MAVSYVDVTRKFEITRLHSTYEHHWDSRFCFLGESHDFWEIVYVDSGRVESVADDRVYMLDGGNVLFHSPMTFHTIRSADGSAPHVMNLSFSTIGIPPENLASGVFSLDLRERAEFMHIFRLTETVVHGGGGEYGATEAASALESFVLRLCRSITAESKQSTSEAASEYRRVVSAMSEAVCDNLTLSELARRTHVSVSYIKLLFARYAGVSPKHYYSTMRATEAARLLSDGMAVGEVAEYMGFSSPNYFAIFFKKHVGATPGEYKRKNRLV